MLHPPAETAMTIVISPTIAAKIAGDDHGNVTPAEVEECFNNHCGKYCHDNRPHHADAQGNPPVWFVAETNKQRLKLKIMFVRENGTNYLKSAYPATPKVIEIYERYAK
jgi:hypothetical protein